MKRHLFFGALLILLAKAIETFIPFGSGQIVTLFANNPDNSTLWQSVVEKGTLLALLILLAIILELAVAYYRNWISEKYHFDLRKKLFAHSLDLKMSYFDKAKVGKLMTELVHDVEKIREMMADSILPMIGTIGLIISVLTFLAFFYPNALYGLFPLSLITALFFYWFKNKESVAYDKYRKSLSEQNTFLQERLYGHNTLRGLVSAKKEESLFEKLNNNCYKTGLDATLTFSSFITFIDLILGSAYVISFLYFASIATLQSPFDAGAFFTFTLWSLMLFRPLGDFAERYNSLLAGLSAFRRVEPLLKEKGEDQNEGLILEQVDEIAFENVHFSYNVGKEVLKGVSFTIKKGQSFGLVGLTGSGKTTISNLLLRFYTPTSGHITINQIPIHEYSLSSLRSAFALVLQDPLLFSGTIEENLRFFNPKVVETGPSPLPHKPLSFRIEELGKNLSVGEKQLIALRRAYITDPQVLILDEATSSIDPLSEQALQNELERALEISTSLIIAHRLTTLKSVDTILVLHLGKIVESGSFETLMQRKSIFYNLYQLLTKELK